jgi:tetratricopeptide (TPR) repeat protein
VSILDKNKAKDPLKQPDMFVSTVGRGWNTVEKNSKVVTTIVALLFLGAIVYVTMDFVNRRADRKASEELYKVEAQYLKIKDTFEKAKADAEKPPEKPKDKADAKETAKVETPAQPASGDLQKDYGTVLPGLEQVADKHANQSAGAQAAVMAADLYLEYKQPEKAVAVLDKVVTKQSSGDLMYGVAHLLRGSALAAKGDCNQAVSDWQKVVDSKKNSFLHPDALLKSGVCYETLKQNDKAMEMYKKVTQDHADSQAAQTAKTYLRAIETTANSAQPNAG